jgi:hypothetical protein
MQTSARDARGSWRSPALWTAVVAGALLSGIAQPADAALTTSSCLAKKVKEWGRLRECQTAEKARALQAKPADPARCQTKFDARLANLNTLASAAGIACRYEVNGDGTVTDYDTGLQWEQKTTDGSVHDRADEHDWSPTAITTGGLLRDGTAFTVFLATLNDGRSRDGTRTSGCFAGHCDWRLPSSEELRTIVDPSAPGCDMGEPCIDQTVFGPTLPFLYWSATSEDPLAVFAWGVVLVSDGSLVSVPKEGTAFVRAVRSAF